MIGGLHINGLLSHLFISVTNYLLKNVYIIIVATNKIGLRSGLEVCKPVLNLYFWTKFSFQPGKYSHIN